MSKRGYISRYLLILKKLKIKSYSTYEELQAYIENQFDYLQMQDDTLNIGFSKRTLQRDIKENRNVFGIGSNLYMNGHNSKLTLEYKNEKFGDNETGTVTLQAMIYL